MLQDLNSILFQQSIWCEINRINHLSLPVEILNRQSKTKTKGFAR